MTETTNYHLSQWAKDDRIRMEDFNADNEKLDAALQTLATGGLKMTVGSYTGTGTHGSDNRNSLSFDFEPKFVYITSGSIWAVFFHGRTEGTTMYTSGPDSVTVSWPAKGVRWYYSGSTSSAAMRQLNTSDTTYNYFAFG